MMSKFTATFKAEKVYNCPETCGVPAGHDIDSDNLQGYVTLEIWLMVNDYFYRDELGPRIETATAFEVDVRIVSVKVLGNVTYFNDSNPDSKDESTTTIPVCIEVDVEAHNKDKANKNCKWEINSADVGTNTNRLNIGEICVREIDLSLNEVVLESR